MRVCSEPNPPLVRSVRVRQTASDRPQLRVGRRIDVVWLELRAQNADLCRLRLAGRVGQVSGAPTTSRAAATRAGTATSAPMASRAMETLKQCLMRRLRRETPG